MKNLLNSFNISTEASSMGDFIAELEESVLKSIKETSRAPADIWEHWQAFSSAINWKEPFIRYLLCFHAVVYSLFFVFWIRKSFVGQSLLFFSVAVLVALSENMNAYCSQNWELLTTQNYFDKHGAFASTLFATPMLVLCLLQLISFLSLASAALIQAKRLEYKKYIRERNEGTSKLD